MTADIAPDEDPFGPFTVAEVEACFSAFDLDNNGFVGASELRKVYQHLGENATDEDIDEMIRMCDADGDGQITFDEFARMIFRHSGPPKIIKKPVTKLLSPKEQEDIISKGVTKKKLKPIGSTIKNYANKQGYQEEEEKYKSPSFKMLTANARADRAFVLKNMMTQIHFGAKNVDEIHKKFLNECDEQKSGMVKYDAFCRSINEKPQNPICKSLFKLFQPNSKQQIDFREFLISVVHLVTNNKELKIKYAFTIFDIDGNGSIDRSELSQILKSTHMATDKQQVESKVTAIMRQIDINGDGGLAFNEFKDITNKFPNLIFPTLNKKR
eukprot:161502_1